MSGSGTWHAPVAHPLAGRVLIRPVDMTGDACLIEKFGRALTHLHDCFLLSLPLVPKDGQNCDLQAGAAALQRPPPVWLLGILAAKTKVPAAVVRHLRATSFVACCIRTCCRLHWRTWNVAVSLARGSCLRAWLGRGVISLLTSLNTLCLLLRG